MSDMEIKEAGRRRGRTAWLSDCYIPGVQGGEDKRLWKVSHVGSVAWGMT